ncbi:hypothetical protein ADK58_36505 [Streptomyces sp. XY152]|nr:hypothetical protein ADK58_36505 [Streptomyces sp. XY152]
MPRPAGEGPFGGVGAGSVLEDRKGARDRTGARPKASQGLPWTERATGTAGRQPEGSREKEEEPPGSPAVRGTAVDTAVESSAARAVASIGAAATAPRRPVAAGRPLSRVAGPAPFTRVSLLAVECPLHLSAAARLRTRPSRRGRAEP